MPPQCEIKIGDEKLFLETGSVARQANGAILARQGDTVIMCTAVCSPEPIEGRDYFPLSVDYREKTYAAGKIPGGYFKREGRPSEKEILISRLMDRPIRPLFPEGYLNEVQIIAYVLSVDKIHDPEMIAMNAASAALSISDIPFLGPLGAVRIGLINDELVVNPTIPQIAESNLNLVVAGTEEAIMMVECGANEVSEDTILSALDLAHENIKKIVETQKEFQKEINIPKQPVNSVTLDENVYNKVKDFLGNKLLDSMLIPIKKESYKAIYDLKKALIESFGEDADELKSEINKSFEKIEKEIFRKYITENKIRTDGRAFENIREITPNVSVLPRTHGSSIFTRGETQALVTCTLGTWVDEQKIDDLEGEYYKSFMLHYNFAPFCVGEVSFLRNPGRREIGHGALAERALKPIIPDNENFPYTLRIVSDILESNGSSSMATVCGGTLSLMDAGVPIKSPVAGIAMGLIKENDDILILSDILGIEDHLGDMDFKVTGTTDGITACQMDIIEIDDTGTIQIASPDSGSANKALDLIKELTQDPEIGTTYHGTVKKITDFGAFVEILPGIDGLVHISQLANHRVKRVEDVLSEGDEIDVDLIDIDQQGRLKLRKTGVKK